MSSVERYVFRLASAAFLMTLVTLTAVIWVTQALREFDLLTGKGQTFGLFLAVTGLSLPLLILVIGPVALFVAVIWCLSKLNGDSELIVMNAAGMSPWKIFHPLLILSLFVSVVTALIALHFAPASMRSLRELVTSIRADVVANIVQEGRFTTLEGGLTFHVRERGQAGMLHGIFVDDARNPDERISFLAEKGRLVDANGSTFLVLEDGSMQRKQAKTKDPSIVLFERYAFDLSQFSGENEVSYYKPREKFLDELIWPEADDPYWKLQPGRFRAELHDRLVSPLYPVVFVFIAFMFLGEAKTTRQGRSAAILGAVLFMGSVRIIGFALSSLTVKQPYAVWLVYILPLGTILFCSLVIGGFINLKVPRSLLVLYEIIATRIDRFIPKIQRET